MTERDAAAGPAARAPAGGWAARHPGLAMALVTLALLIPADYGAGTLTNVQPLAAVRDAAYHHGLLPDMDEQVRWGGGTFRRITNSLGLRDASRRDVPPRSGAGRRIVFIGDSFTEGVGVDYEKTFVGRIAAALAPRGIEVLNAAVQSYSPKLFLLKLQHLVEADGLALDELEVFLDVSDVQDELMYQSFTPGSALAPGHLLRRARDWITRHSLIGRTIAGLAAQRWASSVTRSFGADALQKRALWTVDETTWTRYASRGVALAQQNMTRLIDYARARNIKVRLSVYPWPEQIRAQDLNSKQVTIWRDYAAAHDVAFTNYFPDFVKPDAAAIISRYFIDGDSHWNEAGHALVAARWLQDRGQTPAP